MHSSDAHGHGFLKKYAYEYVAPHPYHVFDDTDMSELVSSIQANGLLSPIIVRNKADGRYELISGHRRKRAYEILKTSEIRAIVVDVDNNEAVILMVDSGRMKMQSAI